MLSKQSDYHYQVLIYVLTFLYFYFYCIIIFIFVLFSVKYFRIFVVQSSQQIIFTGSEPFFVVIYDAKSNLHSIYKICKAKNYPIVCGSNDTSLLYHLINMSLLNVGRDLFIDQSYLPFFG